jgi:hypothetical protein
MENKTGKYFKYAIGEILLVVIGILIALQINNWNINQNEKKQEFKILQDLKVEFNANQKDALRMLDTHMSFIISMNRIQELYALENYNQLELDNAIQTIILIGSYTPRPGASNNLINSGNLSIIQNEELRNQLTVWSGVVEDLFDDEDEAKTYTLNTIIPFMTEYYPVVNIEIMEKVQAIENGWIEEGKFPIDDWYAKDNYKKNYNVKSLLNNAKFQGHVSAKKMFAIHCTVEANAVAEAAQDIVSLIDSEINRIEND